MSSSRPPAPRHAAKLHRRVRPPRRPPRAPREWELIDQLPSALPITQAEIEVLDKMLGAQIDAILKG